MDPITIALIAQATLPVLGALLGDALGQGDQQKAEHIREQIAARYGDQALKDAEANAAKPIEQTEFNKVTEDPRLRAAQMEALRGLEQEFKTGGATPEDLAAYNRAEQETAGFAQGQQAAAARRLAERGMQGGGFQLAQEMAAGQGAAQRMSNASLDIAAQNRRRALQALEQYGQQATGMRGQEYGMSSDKARAQDLINRYNSELRQQGFKNRMSVLDAQGRAEEGVAGDAEKRAARARAFWASLGSAGGKAANAWGAGQASPGAGQARAGVDPDLVTPPDWID